MMGMIMPTSATIDIASESPPPASACCASRNCTEKRLEIFDRAGRLDRRLAVRTHLPERLERSLAAPASFLQLRRADWAREELRLDDRATDGAPRCLAERLLHRLDLELPLAHVLEILRRPEEHVEQRPEER